MFDAIFFDLDGTLLDTERLAIESGLAAFASLGHPTTSSFLHQMIGIDQVKAAEMISAAHPELDLQALDAAWHQLSLDAQARQVPLKPFAEDVVTDLASRFPLALVTSSWRESAMRKLDAAGLSAHFQAIVTRDDVTLAKPHPEPYLLAARGLNADPARCLVFEDSEPGAEAAHRAGMRVVQVPDIVPASGRFAHHIATDLLAGARWAGIIG